MKKFLIGQLGCYGDCLYATTIAKQIKYDFPDSHITWAISGKYKSILYLNPHVDEVWEIEDPENKYGSEIWRNFKKEAIKKKNEGIFDELVFTQIPPNRWKFFDGTIRTTILSGYRRPINVTLDPVIKLSDDEVKSVSCFVAKHSLRKFKDVILFEYSPGSGQSQVNIDFAKEVAERTIRNNPDICFILTSPIKIDFTSPQIIDASELTFRENAELTKYCTLIIGCSSGITWLSTSDWSKKLPTLQLLNPNYAFYAGMHFDFENNRLGTSHIIEMLEYDVNKVVIFLNSFFSENFQCVKDKFHQEYKPAKSNVSSVIELMVNQKNSISDVFKMVRNFTNKCRQRNISIQVSTFKVMIKVISLKIKKKYLDLKAWMFLSFFNKGKNKRLYVIYKKIKH